MMPYFKTMTITLCALLFMAGTSFAASPVNVRAGIHERSNRLVFDWNQKVDYSFQQNGNQVVIQFSAPADLNVRSVNAVKPPFIQNLSYTNTDKGLSVSFLVPTESKIETFRLGPKVAFDVLRMNKNIPLDFNSAAPAPVQASTAPAPTPTETTPPQQTQEVAPPPSEAAKASPTLSRLRTLADRLAEKPSDSLLKNTPNTPVSAPEAVVEKPISGTVIRLKPGKMSKIAAFVRAGKLWLVLDKPLVGLMPDIQGAGISQISQNAKRIDLKEATAFVFEAPPENTIYSITREQFDWIVSLNSSDKPVLPDALPVTTKQSPKDKSNQVSLYTGEQPSIISIRDTAVGDRLWVIPVRAPMGRVVRPRQTLEYHMPTTLSGAVIIPHSDRIRIQAIHDLVVLSSKTDADMRLSNEKDRELGLKEATYTPLFRLDLPDVEEGDFAHRRQLIETRLVEQADPQDKAETLVNMARLYIGNGFGHEALGLLRIAAQEWPAITADQDYIALRGMAAALSGDRTTAEKDLKSQALHSYPAAKLWLGYAMAREGEWQSARAAFVESGNADSLLPASLRNRAVLMKAETAIEAEDVISAEQELKKVTDVKTLTAYEKAAYDYIQASLLALQEKQDEAQPLYEDVAGGRDSLYRVKATLALVEQKLADKSITLKDAIETLEGLRFSWRGDRLETDILRRLGRYYIDDKNYMEGLTVWRQAASLSTHTNDTDSITQEMQETFKDLYIKGASKDMSPLQAVTVFERFRELTPAGKDGHLAMRHLADRLIEVDLLDQADALLEKQMRQNATGVEAAKLGNKLASLRLLNRNPSAAIKALDESFQNGLALPEKLGQTRALLRARALADTGKIEDALYILNTIQTPESLGLKADISWRQNRWSDALSAMQKLLTLYREEGETAVDGPMPTIIMKMAIALALDENTQGMALLKEQYGSFMAQTDKADLFTMITQPSRGSALADLDTLMKQVGEVELFQGFLKKAE